MNPENSISFYLMCRCSIFAKEKPDAHLLDHRWTQRLG
jgi:hypothetical protein